MIQKHPLKLIGFLLLLLAFFVGWFPHAYKRCTHAFRPSKCLIQWPFIAEWEVEPIAEIETILNQPFFYLAKGAQSYVFLSRDQNYVLKLFRFDLSKVPYGQKFVRWMRKKLGLREKHFLSREKKIEKNFKSCKLAYSLAKEQTGLVYVHLNPKKGLPLITVKDRLCRSYKIDPAQYRFVVQKRAEPFLKTLLANRQRIEPYLQSYSQLLDEFGDLGLVNLDRTMGRNFGILDGRVILIDLGNLAYCPEQTKAVKADFIENLRGWLKMRIPEAELTSDPR